MLFNSYEFLFFFLPVTLAGHQLAAHWSRRAVVAWLAVASLAFYAYWRPAYLALLCASVLFNYLAGCLISRRIPNAVPAGWWCTGAIVVNLGALCYYKYFFPFLNFAAAVSGSSHHWKDVILPLGISFFTFTQIAYLLDLREGLVHQQDLGSYALFATFFPHLIAGPILHHAEVMPQFQQNRDYRLRADDMAVGLTWFVMGVAKKVLLADNFATIADPAFASSATLGFGAAWAGVLAYALQLYFDFSGYSDMALGLARMFSIDFPLNFSSPYKASNITDFWNRWHMTLTRYITAYLYNPAFLWINRRRIAVGKKVSRKAMATPSGFLAMVAVPTAGSLIIAGVWHGAGLQFLIFGMLHGTYLSLNQAWRTIKANRKAVVQHGRVRLALNYVGGVMITFVAVCVGHVFFRSANVHVAFHILAGMCGVHSMFPASSASPSTFYPVGLTWLKLAFGYFIVWGFPNTQQILLKFKPAIATTKNDREESALIKVLWRPNPAWALGLGLLFFYVVVKMQNPSSFLYFQF